MAAKEPAVLPSAQRVLCWLQQLLLLMADAQKAGRLKAPTMK
jgi:hypothetical protein